MTYIDAIPRAAAKTGQIRLYGKEGFEGMRKAGELAADVSTTGADGGSRRADGERSTSSCSSSARPWRAAGDAEVSRLHKSVCTSINHVVCHGIPNDKPLREGDIVNIDVTFILDGWHGDSSRMYPVGQIRAPPSG